MRYVIALACIAMMTGCGSIFGVREFEVWSGGPRWQFMEGQDFHVGMNAIDHVENNRGVTRQPSGLVATRSKY